MKNQIILFFLLITSFISKAKVDEIILTDAQIQSITILNDSNKSNDSLACKLLWKKDKALSEIPFSDFLTILQLIKPININAYKENTQEYKLCYAIAKELSSKIISEIQSESADEKFKVINLLKFDKGQYFERNLNNYLQNQIFDFYYNNKVLNYLSNEDYIKLLKPKAVYKLLSDTKTEDKLENEIIFIAHNSKYKI